MLPVLWDQISCSKQCAARDLSVVWMPNTILWDRLAPRAPAIALDVAMGVHGFHIFSMELAPLSAEQRYKGTTCHFGASYCTFFLVGSVQLLQLGPRVAGAWAGMAFNKA